VRWTGCASGSDCPKAGLALSMTRLPPAACTHRLRPRDGCARSPQRGSRGDLVLIPRRSRITRSKRAPSRRPGPEQRTQSSGGCGVSHACRRSCVHGGRRQSAGKRPFCVVATIGTTSSTSIDPVPLIADIAGKHNLWLHVDAAYAGAAAILPEHRYIMAGVERAHSWSSTRISGCSPNRSQRVLYSPSRYPARAFSLSLEILKTTTTRAPQPDGLRRASGSSFSGVEVMVRNALLRTRTR